MENANTAFTTQEFCLELSLKIAFGNSLLWRFHSQHSRVQFSHTPKTSLNLMCCNFDGLKHVHKEHLHVTSKLFRTVKIRKISVFFQRLYGKSTGRSMGLLQTKHFWNWIFKYVFHHWPLTTLIQKRNFRNTHRVWSKTLLSFFSHVLFAHIEVKVTWPVQSLLRLYCYDERLEHA